MNASALQKRIGELEQQNHELERRIARAGEVLAQDALAIAGRADAWLTSIVESSSEAIIGKDLTGIIMSWNGAAERLYGWTAAEMVGQPVLRIVPPELHDEEARILAKVRAGERVEHFETTRVAKDGRRVEVELTVSPVRNGAGAIIGASKIARDITTQREAQRKKDEFLAVLAHELRNPLAPIRNAITLFGQPGVSKAQQDRAHAIAERQFQHISRLLDDLLDVSRLSRGRVELRLEHVELAGLVAHAVDATRPFMAEHRHELRVVQAQEPIRLEADPVRIIQVIANLLANAAKYTDPGGVITLVTRREGKDAVIEVTDNGIGFDSEMRRRLFTLFSQARDAISRAAGGMGIGLALARKFVELHGGSVTGDSAGPGRGSRFVVRLPARG